jgi:hypothetical protein
LAKAYQIEEGENGLNVFCEPCWLSIGTRIKIIKTDEATGLLKGATGIVAGLKRNDERMVVELDNGGGLLSVEDPTAWVVDADYRFVYFAKVNTHDKGYVAVDSSSMSGFARHGHFTQDERPIVHSIRYKGPLTKELAAQLREQFESEKPGLLRLEKNGEAAYLMLSHYPYPTREPRESDQFVRQKGATELKEQKTTQKKFRP